MFSSCFMRFSPLVRAREKVSASKGVVWIERHVISILTNRRQAVFPTVYLYTHKSCPGQPGATARFFLHTHTYTLAYLFISHSPREAASFLTFLCHIVSFFSSVFR